MGRQWIPLKDGSEPAYYQQLVHLYFRPGYDSVNLVTDWLNQPDTAKIEAVRTAHLPSVISDKTLGMRSTHLRQNPGRPQMDVSDRQTASA